MRAGKEDLMNKGLKLPHTLNRKSPLVEGWLVEIERKT